ncbi:alpha/beta hydrolase [Nonomuraea terrae]|uniref:Alpha/beta hydrolase n=1 Tax=Nonomuraea terrae TaxID=2530383 RepID=A0A4R4XSC2_9ACTN|nr:alpha/beta hydrolase [Nonomuraea terrae]TDD34196.1 alpha/beta hydrolase [Nonomuraea terrae]
MTSHTLRVPGASLHYAIRGTGPLLLISQSGEGDADRTTDLVDRLADEYTVVTYDRRGLSRSTVGDPGAGVTVQQHADDVHRLLAHLTEKPAIMLGQSLGATIGLHLAVRHPEQLSLLIAHEPVAPWLLPPAEQARHRAELTEVRDRYLDGGLAAAVAEIPRVLGITADAEPDLTPQPMTLRRQANFDFFLRYDFPAVIQDELDLSGCRTPIVPAAGRGTPSTVFDRRCAVELAKRLGTELAELPGGHNGNTSHPRAYAASLRELLRVSTGWRP